MKSTQPDVDIFAYPDFRLYLSDYMRIRSGRDPSFTQAFICRKLGLPNSRSFFGDVIRGTKPLTPAKTEALLDVLELKGDVARYFRALVLYNQASLVSEKEFHLEQLIALNRSPVANLDKGAFAYYGDWRHSVVRALLDIVDVDTDPSPLALMSFPPIPLPAIRRSLALLKKLGLVQKNEAGYWKPAEKLIHSGHHLQDEILRRYQAACLDQAKAAILVPSGAASNISTETLSLSGTAYRRIVEKLQRFKSEVRSIVHKDGEKADRIYQLNIQLFTHSKPHLGE